jgi:hypothetical protein
MAATPETGFLLIADLTGYTAYLSRSEIEHAPTIAGDLLETVIGRLEPPFRLAKLEGDAAFFYVEDGRAEAPSSSTPLRPHTWRSGEDCEASTRQPTATATRAAWRRNSTSNFSCITAPMSMAGSQVRMSSPDRT